MVTSKVSSAIDSFDVAYQRICMQSSLFSRLMSHCFMWFCKPFFTYYCPLTVIGYENIPIEPFISCSNHSSHMDSAVLMMASGLPFQQCAMVAAEDYFFKQSRKRDFARYLMNLIPIDRHASKESMLLSIKLCEAFIKNNNRNLIIYPEGTRSTDGELHPFKKGPGWIAMRLNLPVIPVYIHGTYQSMPKGKCFPKPQRLTVLIGKPLIPQDYMYCGMDGIKRPNSQSYQLMTKELEARVRELKEQSVGL